MSGRRGTRVGAGVLATAVLAAAVIAVPAARAGRVAAAVPVLGSAFIESVGYGHAHPRTLSSGGNAVTFLVTGITWRNWGARQSVGTGTGYYVPPGSPLSGGRKATEKIVAYDLGTCHGRRAYLKMDWWFPGLTKRHHSGVDGNGNAASICDA